MSENWDPSTVSIDLPFGPDVTEGFKNNVEASSALFDTENAMHLETLQIHPPFIIGRRGAGKTAFLTAPATQEGALVLELKTSQCFSRINQVAGHWQQSGCEIYLSHVRALWRAAIWTAVVARVRGLDRSDILPESMALGQFLDTLSSQPAVTPMVAFDLFCSEMIARTSATEHTFVYNPGLFPGIWENALDNVKDKCVSILRRMNKECLVLMDSMEDFDRVVAMPNSAMSGLLSLAGERRRDSTGFRLRITLPSELYPVIKELSFAPIKDFEGSVLLRWSAAELIRIASTRFALFATTNIADQLERTPFDRMDWRDHRLAEQLFRSSLPPLIRNALGGQEEPVAYILRHTQLLPRHLILFLNRIWAVNRSEGNPDTNVSASAIVRAIGEAEGGIVDEICKAYSPVHPLARQLCGAIIPELPMRFDNSLLHRVFNRHGKRVTGRGVDYHQVRSLLVEIGAIGRLLSEGERYLIAEYEYTVPNKLNISVDEEYCLHPLFAEVFHCKETQGRPSSQAKAVYPFGSDPDAPDIRILRGYRW